MRGAAAGTAPQARRRPAANNVHKPASISDAVVARTRLMNVLLILGHPRKDSLCAALCDAYRDGAREAGARIETLVLADLAFDPHVRVESPEQQAYEPDIERARELIDWADHLVFVYPTWWGTMPALLKGFLDRVVTPGFGFRFKAPDSIAWEGLWKNKSAQIITTMDTPPPVYRWIYRQPGCNAMRRATLGFCGVRSVRALVFGSVRISSLRQRRNWLERARRAGFAVRGGRWARLSAYVSTWLTALRLQFYPMSWAAYTIGALVAAGTGVFASAVYWWGYVCLFSLEAATVFANDYFDYRSDTLNRAAGPFSGGSRVLVERRLSFAALRTGVAVALAIAAVAAGFAINLAPYPLATAVLLAVALALTLGYTVPPLKLCYRGLGELDVAFTHSFMVLFVGYLLQGGAWQAAAPWLLALPLCVAVLPAIILSALPDYGADAATDKGTLAVRLGPRPAMGVALAVTAAAALLALLWSHLPQTRAAYKGIVWGVLPHAGLLGVLLFQRLQRAADSTDARIDGLMVVALTYILWFVVVPFWNLV